MVSRESGMDPAGRLEGAESKTQRIPNKMYFRIGDVAELVGVKPYVLRYWETEFPMIAPDKSSSGQRVYRRADVETVFLIKHLLYKDRYSIEGARNRIKELRKEGGLKKLLKKVLTDEAAKLDGAAESEPEPASDPVAEEAVADSRPAEAPAIAAVFSDAGPWLGGNLEAAARLAELASSRAARAARAEALGPKMIHQPASHDSSPGFEADAEMSSEDMRRREQKLALLMDVAEELSELSKRPLSSVFRY